MQLRRDALGEHMEEVARDTQYWAGDRAIREILVDLKVAWSHQGHRASQKLRRAYITENPNPVGERQQLTAARDGSDERSCVYAAMACHLLGRSAEALAWLERAVEANRANVFAQAALARLRAGEGDPFGRDVTPAEAAALSAR